MGFSDLNVNGHISYIQTIQEEVKYVAQKDKKTKNQHELNLNDTHRHTHTFIQKNLII